ncbi:MAG: single-stranded-DNA-specific exonuclease RecJ [Acidobacteriaceae bacterium]|nr:single-stranded-DNA-specific exonuclease RecJ [Acidobacteriaceae bacterium]
MPQSTEHRPTERWLTLAEPNEASADLARELGLPEQIAALLVCRGLDTPSKIAWFLHPTAAQLHSPLLMLGMSTAVKRLRAALLASQPILIYGDYDVDGTVATVLLKTAIERAAVSLNVSADVRYHIPHRIREGYGIQSSRLTDAYEEGVRLVVSVDTGIRAFAAAEEAKRLGLDLIVTDHHLPDGAEGVPEAVAVLNPNQPGCPYPYKELCGAAVSFKLAQALLESAARDDEELARLRTKTLPSFLKLLAVATIADAVPLNGENRVIASLGLEELRKPSQSGLRTLMELASIDLSRPISGFDVGFRIAPRINAAGRMDIASDVVEMFLTRDAALARSLAEKLHQLNDERKTTEADALREIEARLDAMAASEEGLAAALVLDDAEAAAPWHRGVLGILASRVVDRTATPALVLTHEPSGDAHGSGRSVAGFHLLDAITAAHNDHRDTTAEPLFHRFGGHAHAVGFSLPSTNVAALRERLTAYAATHAPVAPEVETRECDLELSLDDLTQPFFDALEQLGPFGNGNTEPLFLTRNVRLASAIRVIKERHLRLQFEDVDSGRRIGGMAWSRARTDFPELARERQWAQGSPLDVVYRLRRNWHPDFGGWEMEVLSLRDATV